jgi:2',3'-cyclic-nucleotide 2'-phosphodiesterase (5'-nucleotidase family)
MGTLFHTSFVAEASELRLMGDMGYDVVTFGNHDFDFHSHGLAEMLRAAKSKGPYLPRIVASNMIFNPGAAETSSLRELFRNHPVKEYVVLEKNGIRMGLFGIMGNDAAEDTPFAAPVSFADPIHTGKRMVDVLKNEEKVDIVICLSHSGTSSDKKRSEDEILARKVPGIDVIVSGHTHTILYKPIVVGKTIIVSSGSYGAYLGILGLNYSTQAGATIASYELKSVSHHIPEDKKVATKVADFKRNVDTQYLAPYKYRYDQVIARSDFHMEDILQIYAHTGETGLGNMITDAFRHAVKKTEGKNYDHIHCAIQPIGMIRSSFLEGDISVADVFRVLSLGLGTDGIPGYPLVTAYINGDELKSLLEVETSVAPFKNDAHLQVSGVQFTYNPHRIPFDRITSVEVGQASGEYEPLESKRLYRVCMNFYTANMVDFIRRSSHGLLRIEPKDKEGRPITDIRKAIVHESEVRGDAREIKEWVALAKYLATFPDTDGDGIPNIPEKYRGREGRFSSVPSWNPVNLIAGGNYLTYGVLTIAMLILGLVGGFIWLVARRLLHR